jgi:hypothetical protein
MMEIIPSIIFMNKEKHLIRNSTMMTPTFDFSDTPEQYLGNRMRKENNEILVR